MGEAGIEVAVAYFSGEGHTRRLAEGVAAGAQEAQARAVLIDVEDLCQVDWQRLHDASAIVFGAPTYMGSAAAPFKAFMDATSNFWLDGLWADKIAAGFTVGSAASGDKSNTLLSFVTLAAQHGMIWVGQSEIGPPARPDNAGINQDGFWLGLAATSSRDKLVLIEQPGMETARRFGCRIGRAAQRWHQCPEAVSPQRVTR
ncbi:flavodoxin family protein [Roseobacter denitrificans]|uniref:Flavodoxin-like domain-containing protein n=1 Tax=Roseobacter denitrificans (strain ATCC 33942 / OCh 114) TaxID=375451 RepID=Q16BE4_ROSDO|nr:flavodoxin family protein [Roseobacter denitrificans]ABG30699.1 conserved hypothetical protein [Roseobacter denitrificans OCh 114]AVL53823.1 flavodoxin family protein [Roseobacter denitrificans]SFG18261.1 NAD(P)H dehydrogenase (quinone) [Roseobacter denitrificans OCh 114]